MFKLVLSKPGIFGSIFVGALVLLGLFSVVQYYIPETPLTHDQALAELTDMRLDVGATFTPANRTANVPLNPAPGIEKTLPDISQYPFTVDPALSSGDVAVEIFVTTIRGWGGVVGGRERPADGLTTEIAEAFNAADIRLADGRRAKLRVRYIASGTAYEFISSGRHMPDAYSPVHHLWIRMLEAKGVPVTPIAESMAMSAGGVVIRSEIANQLRAPDGSLDVKAMIDKVVRGDIAMGYTNPFASSTGLNFLVTILSSFAGGDDAAMLSPAVADTFEQFQRNVPFIALTTVEMRESVLSEGGSLDAFVMGYQTFISAPQLEAGFEFIPFGVAHDQPLYAVGDIGSAKLEALELFAKFADQPRFRAKADEYGWNRDLAKRFSPTVPIPTGETLIRAQRLWKEKKDAGQPIAAVFLSDVSGSMNGARIAGVRKALIAGSEFIGPENSIGLVLFSDKVRVVLPVRKFDMVHRARFVAAVEDMRVGGSTAMYDGVIEALSLLVEEKRRNPRVKPMLFVLTDGETNKGYGYGAVEAMVRGVGIPINTVGYEADIAELTRLARLVEATTVKAGEGNVVYKIASLLNAKM
ncbi:MAG: vWA domain-containing protein [Alphaproteobacteria bacterium]